MERLKETPESSFKDRFFQTLADRKTLWLDIINGSRVPEEYKVTYRSVLDEICSPDFVSDYDDVVDWYHGWGYNAKGRLVDIHLPRIGHEITDPDMIKEFQAVYFSLRDDIDAFVKEVDKRKDE